MRKFTGIIVSDKMDKTVTVLVERSVMNKIYKKRYKVSKKYKAHTEDNLKNGQKVLITETRPLSKTKSWKVLEVIS